MNATIATRALLVFALVVGLSGCSSMGSATSLFDQLGGTNGVRSLSDAFVNNVAGDSRTKSLLSNANMDSLKTSTSDQFCALLGGSCKAPLTESQISDAGKKVNASTSSALSDSLGKALDSVKAVPGVKEGVTKLLGPQLGGIVGGLL
jgi:hemoglobin